MQPLPATQLRWHWTLGLAGVAGILIALGFEPFGLWPATIVGAGLFTWLFASRGVAGAAVHGLIVGATLNTLSLHWMAVLGVSVAVGLVAVMSLWFLLLGVCVALLTRLRYWVLWVPLSWVAVETAAGSFPFGGFPWIRLGITALNQPLSGWFAVIGSAGVSLLVALVSNLILLAIIQAKGRVVGTAVVVSLFGVGGALLFLPADTPDETVNVGLVQGNVSREQAGYGSPARSVVGNNLSETIILLAENRANAEEPLDFIMWPENATDIDPLSDATTGRAVETAVALADIPIMVGAVMDGPAPETRQTSTLWWDPDSGISSRYDKRNLVPFGEWIPMRDLLLPRFPVLEQIGRQSVPGEGPGVLDAPLTKNEDFKVGTIICYELAWDSTSYDTITGGAQVLSSQSNTNTYAGTFEVHQQMALNQVRALEARREVIVSTLNGLSGLVDVHGKIHEETRELTTANRTFTVPLRSNITPGVILGPWISIAASGLSILALAWAMSATFQKRRVGRLHVGTTDRTEAINGRLPSTRQDLGDHPDVQRGSKHREHHSSPTGVGSSSSHPRR